MAEGEQGLDIGALIVAIADEDALSVVDFEVLAGPVVVRRRILDALGESAL